MREHLDCAVLVSPFNEDRAMRLRGSHAGGRLVVHQLDVGGQGGQALAGAAMVLRRYDACLIQVCPANLSWVRTNLQAARPMLATPVIAITRKLKAAALDDLHQLGVDDFLREPFCAEDLRARCERLLGRQQFRRYLKEPGLPSPALADAAVAGHTPAGAVQCVSPGDAIAALAVPALESYAMAAAGEGAGAGASLRAAKSQVVEHFETAYIKAALHRHQGNIAMAARSVQKHRRAFWALMHKYKIDPMPYRAMGRNPPEPCRPGKMPANFSEG